MLVFITIVIIIIIIINQAVCNLINKHRYN